MGLSMLKLSGAGKSANMTNVIQTNSFGPELVYASRAAPPSFLAPLA
jgi:hypothetical protein